MKFTPTSVRLSYSSALMSSVGSVSGGYDLHLFYERCLSMHSAFVVAAGHYEDVASMIVDRPLEAAWTGSGQ